MNRNASFGLSLLAALGLAAPAGAAPAARPAARPAAKPAAAAPAPREATAAPESASARPAAKPAEKPGEAGGTTLRGGEEGTVFRSLTIEGEDRIHIDVERPPLRLELDPQQAPGLDWGSARDVPYRTTPDLAAPLLASSALESSPYVARPWLMRFARGPVARFQPDVKGVEQWKLSVVDARAQIVASWQGRGEPPREIAWDGRLASGDTLVPGATYSYVLEARDRAGNKRNFVGEGFRAGAVCFDGPGARSLVFTGRELDSKAGGTPEIVLEAATWLNQWPEAARGVRVEATGRTFEEASALASRVTAALAPALLGDPARIQGVTAIAPDAPEGGTVRITPGR